MLTNLGYGVNQKRKWEEVSWSIIYVKRPLPFWAVVDAIPDLSAAAKRALAEEYSNSMNFSDGVIYRNIKEYNVGYGLLTVGGVLTVLNIKTTKIVFACSHSYSLQLPCNVGDRRYTRG